MNEKILEWRISRRPGYPVHMESKEANTGRTDLAKLKTLSVCLGGPLETDWTGSGDGNRLYGKLFKRAGVESPVR